MQSFLRRRLVAPLVAVIALLLLPALASASANWSTSTLTSAGPYTSGSTVTYTFDMVNTGDAAVSTSGYVTLGLLYNSVTIVGTPTIAAPAAGTDQSSHITWDNVNKRFNVDATFGAGAAHITLQLQLPETYNSSYKVRAYGGTLGGSALLVSDAERVVSSGGPSRLVLANTDAQPLAATKDSTPTLHYRLTNLGSGPANFTTLTTSNPYGDANAFSPTWAPATPFTPTAVFGSGCTTITDAGHTCTIGTIAAHASVDLTVNVAGIDHYGYISVSVEANAADTDDEESRSVYLPITDGTRAETNVVVHGPYLANGNTDLTYTGSVQNIGTTPLSASLLTLELDAFDAAGHETNDHDIEVSSLKSLTLSNGVTCAKFVDMNATPNVTYNNKWVCPIAGIAAGARVTFTLVANFPTSLPYQRANVDADLESLSTITGDEGGITTSLNFDTTATLSFAASGPAMIGTGRIAPVTFSVTNTGNTTLYGAGISVRAYGGTYVDGKADRGCAIEEDYVYLYCAQQTGLAPGATAKWTAWLRGGDKLGQLVLSVGNTEYGTDAPYASYGNWYAMGTGFAMQIVRANAVPLVGVGDAKLAKAKLTLATLAKLGLVNSVKCPVACRASVQLQLPRALAVKLGFAKGKKTGKPVIIGSGVAKRTSAGTVVVKTKLKKATAKRVLKLTKTLTLVRVLTVTSTDPDTADASFQKVSTVKFVPTKAKRKHGKH